MPSAESVFFEYLRDGGRVDETSFDRLCMDHADLAEELRGLAEHHRAARVALGLTEDGDGVRNGGEAGRLQVRGEIARGGMGVVLEVWDGKLRRALAMKTLRVQEGGSSSCLKDARSRSRLVNEAQVLGQLDHPGVVPVHELGEDLEGRPFFTMKLVRGRTLAELLEDEGESSAWSSLLNVVLRVCEAVAYAHSKGVLHRDLKPSNVMIGAFGEVYVMDWGLARVRSRSPSEVAPELGEDALLDTDRSDQEEEIPGALLRTLEGEVLGTPAYMCPEQAAGRLEDVDERCDVYSVGAILYHMLTGRAPYAEATPQSPQDMVDAVRRGTPEPLEVLAPQTPRELLAICLKAMARRREHRYASMLELAQDLSAFLEGNAVSAYRGGHAFGFLRWVRRNRLLAAAVGLTVLSVLGGLAGVGLVEARGRRIAEANEQRALRERDRANANREEVLRLSAARELDRLVDEARELWPPRRELLPAYDDWLVRAADLAADLPDHRRTLAVLRARALPLTPQEGERALEQHPLHGTLRSERQRVESLRAELGAFGYEQRVDEHGHVEAVRLQLETALAAVQHLEARIQDTLGVHLDDPQDTWWEAELTDLTRALESFVDPATGLMGSGLTPMHGWGVARRREQADSVNERSMASVEARQLWAQATAAIAADPRYSGLQVTPQFGLLPLGPDPRSGLWEFWHVLSGEEPRRGDGGVLELPPESGVVLVLIPGGTFLMGAQSSDQDAPHFDTIASMKEAVHDVTVSPFFISKFELTQAQWVRMAGRNPSNFNTQNFGGPLHPVEQVSWWDCVRVLGWLDLVLPTEAQWEYAARAGTDTIRWTGDDPESLNGHINVIDESVRNVWGNEAWVITGFHDGFARTAPVDALSPNPFGLHHILGNIYEWCLDGFSPEFYQRSPPVDPFVDPQGKTTRAIRDCAFNSPLKRARSSNRQNAIPEYAYDDLGVRPARALVP